MKLTALRKDSSSLEKLTYRIVDEDNSQRVSYSLAGSRNRNLSSQKLTELSQVMVMVSVVSREIIFEKC